jgi:PAS domain S-box-containing protein
MQEAISKAESAVRENINRPLPPAIGTILIALLLSATYYFGAVIGFTIRFPSSAIPPILPTNAILLAVLLLNPNRRIWWIFLLAIVPAHMAAALPIGIPMWGTVWQLAFNILLTLLITIGLTRFFDGLPRFDRKRDVIVYISTIAVVLGVLCFASPAFVLTFTSFASRTGYPLPADIDHWTSWWLVFLSNFLAFITITPVVLLWAGKGMMRIASSERFLEAALLVAGLVGISFFIFGGPASQATSLALLYVPLPLLLWAAVRLGPVGTYSASLILTLTSVWSAIVGHGPFIALPPELNLLSLQIFLSSITIPFMLLVAAIQEQLWGSEELRLSGEALRRQFAQLSTIYNTAPVGLAFVDTDLRYVSINDQLAEFDGSPAEAHIGKRLREVLPGLADLIEPIYHQVIESGESMTGLEYHGKTMTQPDIKRDWLVSHYPVKDKNGVVIGVNTVLQEITERIRTEQALRESAERNRAILRAMPDMIFLQSRDGVYLDYHVKDRSDLLLPPEMFLNRNVREVFPLDLALRFEKMLEQALYSEEPVVTEYSLPLGEEQRYFEARTVSCDSDKLLSIVRDITGRKQAEEMFKKAFENNPQPMAIATLGEGRFIDINQAYEEMSGFKRSELIGYTSVELNTWEVVEARADFIRQIEEHGVVRNIEARYRTKTGALRVVLASADKIELGGKKCVLFTLNDITERQLAEEALRESERRFRAIFDNIGVGMSLSNLEGIPLETNQTLQQILGYTAEELRAGAFKRLSHPEDLALGEHFFNMMVKGEIDLYRIEQRYYRKDGGVVWTNLTVSLVRDDLGRPQFTIAMAEDITQRKHAEELLSQSEELNRRILESSSDAIMVLNLDGMVLYMNAGGLRGMEINDENMYLNKSMVNFWYGSERQGAIEAIAKALGGGRGTFSGYCPTMKGISKWWDVVVTPITDANGRVVQLLAISRDITERKAAEEALVVSEEALRESYSRIEYLAGRLLVAHEEERKYIARELHDDLNQQVAALALGLGKLERQLRNADLPIRNQLEKLEDRVTKLSEQIRRLSHELHSSTLEHVGLTAALKLYCSEFAELQGISVNIKIEGNIEPMSHEAALCLYRVAQESLHNIAKHSGVKKAEVTIRGSTEAIELRISDEGKGFNRDQVKERQGLGLVSIEERVKLLRGSFEVNSKPGTGTELRVRIPRVYAVKA